jgi:hypothetical protein
MTENAHKIENIATPAEIGTELRDGFCHICSMSAKEGRDSRRKWGLGIEGKQGVFSSSWKDMRTF